MKLYKVLGGDGQAFHGGQGRWYLPEHGRPGKWMPAIEGPLVACKNGYHLCRALLADLQDDIEVRLSTGRWANGEVRRGNHHRSV